MSEIVINKVVTGKEIADARESMQQDLKANPERFAALKDEVVRKTENVQKLDNAFRKFRGKMLTVLEASGLTPDSLVAMKKLFKNDTGELWNSVTKIITDLETRNENGKSV